MFKILILLILVTGCSNEVNEDNIIKIEKDVNVYENIYLNSLIGEDIINNHIIDTNQIGTFTLSAESKSNKYEVTINVVDNTLPLIFGSSTYTIGVNQELDLLKAIGYGDNYDRQPQIQINGDFDNTKVGEYEIDVIVTDSSNNETKKDIIVKVVEELSSSYNLIELDDIITKHKNENTSIGIDVSTWQDDINWQEVKEFGVEFAIIRIGFGYTSSGELVLDNRYVDNIKEAKEVGLPVGVYFFSYANNTDEAIKQAKWVVETLDGLKLELPIVFDWEDFEDFEDYQINFKDINDIATSFLTTVEDSGYEGMLYGSASYLENIWDVDYKTWLAHYTEQTDFTEDYYIWQLTSIGSIDGISGPVDVNVLYK